MYIEIDLPIGDIAQRAGKEEAFELIKELELHQADWDFTFECLSHFIGIVKSSLHHDDIVDELRKVEKEGGFKLTFDE